MSFLALAGLAGAGVASYMGMERGEDAANKAATQREDAIAKAIAAIDSGETKALDYVSQGDSYYKPYYETGTSALARYGNLLGLNGKEAADTAMSEFNVTPSYNFRVGEGVKALDRSASSKGGLYSGATGKNLIRFGQDAGSQEFNSYLDRLAGVSTQGQNAATGRATFAGKGADVTMDATRSRANAMIGVGEAQAGGTIGSANAFNQGMSNLAQIGMYGAGIFSPGAQQGKYPTVPKMA